MNNVWQWGEPYETYWAPTAQQPIERWDSMFTVGVRGHLLATKYAIPLLAKEAGIVVSTQERPGDDEHFGHNIVVDAAAVAVQRMVQYLARELDDRPGMSRADLIAVTQSPQFIGRAIAELAADEAVHDKSGRTIYCGDLATEYGFTDVDGRVP